MSAFNYNDKAELYNAVDDLLRPIRSHNTVNLRLADVRSLLMAREECCTIPMPFTVEWCHPRLLQVERAGVKMSFYAQLSADYDVKYEPDFIEQITSWVIQHRQHAYEIALCKRVIDELDKVCPTANTVRFHWPTLQLLCNKRADHLPRLAARVSEFKPMRNAPSIPLYLRNAMREATAILTMASMHDGKTGGWHGEVSIACSQYFHFKAYEMGFGGQ